MESDDADRRESVASNTGQKDVLSIQRGIELVAFP